MKSALFADDRFMVIKIMYSFHELFRIGNMMK